MDLDHHVHHEESTQNQAEYDTDVNDEQQVQSFPDLDTDYTEMQAYHNAIGFRSLAPEFVQFPQVLPPVETLGSANMQNPDLSSPILIHKPIAALLAQFSVIHVCVTYKLDDKAHPAFCNPQGQPTPLVPQLLRLIDCTIAQTPGDVQEVIPELLWQHLRFSILQLTLMEYAVGNYQEELKASLPTLPAASAARLEDIIQGPRVRRRGNKTLVKWPWNMFLMMDEMIHNERRRGELTLVGSIYDIWREVIRTFIPLCIWAHDNRVLS